jgi:hypothetical protein
MKEKLKILALLEWESPALKKAFQAVSDYSTEPEDIAFNLMFEAHLKIHGENQNLM